MNHLTAALDASSGDVALEMDYDTALTLWRLYADENRLSEILTDTQYTNAEYDFMSAEMGEDSYDLYMSTH